MREVKQIFAFLLASVVLLTTIGFALHTIQCQLNGDTYYSIIDKKCCCGVPDEKERKCCEEQSLVVKVDSQAALKEFNFNVNPLFVAAFLLQHIELNFPAEYQVDYLGYFKHSPLFPEQEIIILVQSFLL